MRHVGIVARILDDASRGRFAPQRLPRQGEARPFAFGQADFNGIGELAGEKRNEGSLRRGGGAGPGGPASAQGPARLFSHVDILKGRVSI